MEAEMAPLEELTNHGHPNLDDLRPNDNAGSELPIITIFGGGVAGLSTAHELIERGFTVQLVEEAESKFEENECEIGGLAANQLSRVPASIKELHPKFLEEEEEGEGEGEAGNGAEEDENAWQREPYSNAEKSCLKTLRRMPLSEAQRRFPILETLQFDRDPGSDIADSGYTPGPLEPDEDKIPADWQDYWDCFGVLNKAKVELILNKLVDAYGHYSAIHRQKIVSLGNPEWMDFASDANSEMALREILFIRITGYTDSDDTAKNNRIQALEWAEAVKTALIAKNELQAEPFKIPRLAHRIETKAQGSANPKFDQSTPFGRRLSNRVEIEIVEQTIPGEHGFRFFPSFYRHLFDIMRRTPLLDRHGFATGKSAFQQLVATPGAMLAINDGRPPIQVTLRRVHSVRQIQEALDVFMDRLGFQHKDLLGLQYFTARYLTSCSLRRQKEGEPNNFVEYIGGRDKYSDAAMKFVNNAPRALAAMSATESDARTQLDVYIQLMAMAPDQSEVADMTLNGPTNLAWLDHWKRYLKVQGVRFFKGKLNALELDDSDAFLPKVEGPDKTRVPRSEDPYIKYLDPEHHKRRAHKFVLAVSYQKASDLVADAYKKAMSKRLPFHGPFRQLLEFDLQSERRNEAGDLLPIARDPNTGAPLGAYPLRTISGIQYFFSNMYRFGTGNLYLPDSPWGLTSISQFAYWQDRIQPVGQFLGQISVDIGQWHDFYPEKTQERANGTELKPPGSVAWNSSLTEIVHKTWDQMKDSLQKSLAKTIVAPRFYHMDRKIVFHETNRVGFNGNLRLKFVELSDETGFPSGYEFHLQRTTNSWSNFERFTTSSQSEDYGVNSGSENTIDQIVAERTEAINKRNKDGKWVALGISASNDPDVPGTETNSEEQGFPKGEILISPYTTGKSFVVWLNPDPNQKYYFAVDGEAVAFNWQSDTTDYGAWFSRQLGQTVDVKHERTSRNSVLLTIDFPSGKDFSVANRDGQIEVIDGDSIAIEDMTSDVQIISGPTRGSGIETATSVRSNAIISFRRSGIVQDQLPEPGRTFGIKLGVQGHPIEKKITASPADGWEQLRDQFFDFLENNHSDSVVVKKVTLENTSATFGANVAEPGSDRPENGTGEQQEDIVEAIIVSPIVAVREINITLAPFDAAGPPAEDFFVRMNGHDMAVPANGQSPSEVRDQILQVIAHAIESGHVSPPAHHEFALEATGSAGFRVTLRPTDRSAASEASFSIGVLNQNRHIELTDGPAMSVTTKDLPLDLPSTAFVPLRNDGEFLINRPGQWKYRPGLFDWTTRQHLSKTNPDSETRGIYYGHLDCPPLQNWFNAGTYMATYTRMTTMEAAAESARHAVSAILHEIMVKPAEEGSQSALALPSNFPEIWDPERQELPDLDYWKEVDEELAKLNLPHVFDILGLDRFIAQLLQSSPEFDNTYQQIVESREAIKEGLSLLARSSVASQNTLKDQIERHLKQLLSIVEGEKQADSSADFGINLLRHLIDQLES